MKKYIILASCINGMGGAQMYFRNKCLYLQTKGWDVSLLSAQEGRVLIDELKQYNWFIPEFGFDYYLFSKKKREKIINQIINKLIKENYDEIIIESSCFSECTWGEVLAKMIGARHLCFVLQEFNPVDSFTIRNFLIFKHKRHELAGIAPQSLLQLFSSFYPITQQQSYYLLAHCRNVVADIKSDILEGFDRGKYDYVIGCLSRLDKPFIIPALVDFVKYAKHYADKRFLLLMIGGAPDGTGFKKNITNLIRSVKNVDLIITGFIYPIPISLLEYCDAFFSSAGSAGVCMRSGVPTISYDGYDFKPIGIMGKTTGSTLMRKENEPIQSLSRLLDQILFEKKYRKEPSTHELSKPDFSPHDKFLSEMAYNKEYYNFDCIKRSGKETIMSFLLGVIGAKGYYKLGEWKRKILKKNTSDR